MSAICGIVRQGLDDYLSDALPAPQRRILREHLAACEACRSAAASKDASLLFARRVEHEGTPEETAQILEAVRTGVGHIETERRIRASRSPRRRSAVAAAVAAAALLALTPGALSRRAPQDVAVAKPAAPVPTRVAATLSAQAGIEAASLPAEAGAPSSEATVYDLNPGAGREEPRVVWIVDRGLDI